MKIRRALISVWDKTGIVDFARALHDEFGVEIISTGGTAKALADAGIPVTLVEQITGCGEMLDGRVKTLHPKIHAAILADRDNPEHMRQLAEAGIEPIDMVVVNLYPFEKTVADANCTFEQALEMIDIGGVALLRAAAKNHRHVFVFSMRRYDFILETLRGDVGADDRDRRYVAAVEAFLDTTRYDAAISQWLSSPKSQSDVLGVRFLEFVRWGRIRYGENPHQSAELLQDDEHPGQFCLPTADSASICQFELSYNNYLDADAALALCAELTRAKWNFARTGAEACAKGNVAGTDAEACAKGNFAGTDAEARAKWNFARTGAEGSQDGGAGLSRGGSAKFHFAPAPAPTPSPAPAPAPAPSLAPAPAPTPSPTPASRASAGVTGERTYRRKLPHWQISGATYFVTFSSAVGAFSDAERDCILEAVRFWDGRKLDLHVAVVMTDHVHLLLTPRQLAPESEARHDLTGLLQSIKANSARAVNRLRRSTGQVWVRESYDRWIRNVDEFFEKWNYIANNPVKEGLAPTPEAYRWYHANEAVDPFVESHASCRTGGEENLRPGEENLRPTPQVSCEEARPTPLGYSEVPLRADSEVPLRADSEVPLRCAVACFVKHSNPCGVGVVHAGLDSTGLDFAGPDATRPDSSGPDATEPDSTEPDSTEPDVTGPNATSMTGGTCAASAARGSQFEAYRRAYLGDPNAAMGGVLAVNFTVDAEFAAMVMETYDRFGKPLKEAGAANAPGGFFIEVWIAPAFDEEAVEVIRVGKKWGANVRLLAVWDMGRPPDPNELLYRSIAGGMLVQSPDLLGLNEDEWKVVTKRAPTDVEMADLRLAWLICKHTKSNAITLVRDGMLLGNGAGQMSRVMSCRVATWLARENGHLRETGNREAGNREQGEECSPPSAGPASASPPSAERRGVVAASDAFFPFADGPRLLIDAGVTAIIQPGGSKRDQETIDLCDARGVAMIFTGTRHFRH